MSLSEFFKYLEDKEIQSYIVALRYKYFWEPDWNYSREILEWDSDLEVYDWRNYWDESYDLIQVLGYIAIDDVDIPRFEGEITNG